MANVPPVNANNRGATAWRELVVSFRPMRQPSSTVEIARIARGPDPEEIAQSHLIYLRAADISGAVLDRHKAVAVYTGAGIAVVPASAAIGAGAVGVLSL